MCAKRIHGGQDMKENQKIIQAYSLIFQLGFSVIVPVLMCIFLASWIEDKYSLVLDVPLIIVGILAGGRNAWILARQVIKSDNTHK